MDVQPGNRPAVPRDWTRGLPERYVAGADTRGRPEGRPDPRSQQAIYEISGLRRLSVQGLLGIPPVTSAPHDSNSYVVAVFD